MAVNCWLRVTGTKSKQHWVYPSRIKDPFSHQIIEIKNQEDIWNMVQSWFLLPPSKFENGVLTTQELFNILTAMIPDYELYDDESFEIIRQQYNNCKASNTCCYFPGSISQQPAYWLDTFELIDNEIIRATNHANSVKSVNQHTHQKALNKQEEIKQKQLARKW